MQDSPHARRAIFGLLASQILLGLRVWMLFHFHGDNIKISGPVVAASQIMVGVIFLQCAWGIHRHRSWAGSRFLILFLIVLPQLVAAMFFILRSSWLFGLILPLEAFAYFFVLYHFAKIPKDYWKPRARGWRHWLRADRALMALFWIVAIELGLNVAGLKPGEVFPNRYFQKVEQLVVWEDYHADANGLTKLSPAGAELAATGIWKGEAQTQYRRERTFSPSTFSVYEDWTELKEGDGEGPFAEMITELQAKPDSLCDSLDRAHLIYLQRPINAEGYRSIPFVPYPTHKKSVLLLGDSFTFGWSARPWYRSFADHLRTLGYVVYNTGITATGPDQYAAAARTYIPRLKPDFIIANFFLGNDIIHYPVRSQPYEMVFYPTNAGIMQAHPALERLPDADSAYSFMVQESYIQASGVSSTTAQNTVLGTLAWKVAYRYGLLIHFPDYANRDYFLRNQPYRSDRPVSEDYMVEAKALSEAHGATFICSVIPDLKNPGVDLSEDHPELFTRLSPVMMECTEQDFDWEDRHFNNDGHQRYAEFLDSLMGGAQ